MKLTLKQLQDAQACAGQVARFQKLFGSEVDVTEELCVEHAGTVAWSWAARFLLTPKQRAAFERATKPTGDAYNVACSRAFARAYNS